MPDNADMYGGEAHFRDRVDAGRKLAEALQRYRGRDAVVYALPRGGVVVGAEIARALQEPLDVIIARKVGHPLNPEYAICAVTENGPPICNEEERARVDSAWLGQAIRHERDEAARRRQRYRAQRPPISARGKIAIIVDDGIATGLTMFAAIAEIKTQHPRQIVVAVPVIPPQTAARLRAQVDEVVAIDIPDFFQGAVGAYYAEFAQVTDEEVMVLLHAAAQVAAPLLYAFPDYQPLAAGLHRMVDVRDGNFARGRFANGELYIQLHTLPDRAHCIALGTIAPPDEQLLALVLLCHTLRKEGAGEITALLPYLAYARQDRDEPGRSRAIGWMGTALQDAGITEIVTVDIHSRQAVELFPIPVFSLAPAALYAAEIQNLAWQHAALVAPDAGAVGRCEAVKEAGGLTGPIIHLRKERTADGVHSELEGNAESQAVIIDDMLDTGETLLACCQALRQAGTERIMIMVTHGLFTGTAWERLWDLGVERLFCMDTVPHPAMRDDERIRTISALPLIAEFFQHNS